MSKEEVIEKLKKLKQEDTELSWSAIERKIKMPKNNLVGMINGSRGMPQKWVDALDKFLKSEATPSNFIIDELYKFTIDGWVHVEFETSPLKPPEASKTEEKQKDKETAVPEKEVENKAEIEARIAFLEKELKSPPTNPSIGLKMWISIRQSEINNLKKQLIN